MRVSGTCELTLGDVFLAVTAANTHAVDDIALLSLVAQSASLVGTGGTGGAVDDVQLAELPAPEILRQLDRGKRPS